MYSYTARSGKGQQQVKVFIFTHRCLYCSFIIGPLNIQGAIFFTVPPHKVRRKDQPTLCHILFFLIRTQICLGSDMMRGVNKHLDTENDNFNCSAANSVINTHATKCHTLLISRRLRHNCHSFLQCKKSSCLSCKKVIFRLPYTFFHNFSFQIQ